MERCYIRLHMRQLLTWKRRSILHLTHHWRRQNQLQWILWNTNSRTSHSKTPSKNHCLRPRIQILHDGYQKILSQYPSPTIWISQAQNQWHVWRRHQSILIGLKGNEGRICVYGMPPGNVWPPICRHNCPRTTWKILEEHGYTQIQITPGLLSHKWRSIQFTLVVDGFGVKYIGD